MVAQEDGHICDCIVKTLGSLQVLLAYIEHGVYQKHTSSSAFCRSPRDIIAGKRSCCFS